MATNFPTSVDNFTNPTANDSLNLPSHSTQHANANDAIEAIETTLFAGGINYTGLVHINTTSFTAQSSVSVSNVFSSNYDAYKIIIVSEPAVGNPVLNFRLRDSGGDVSLTNYFWQYLVADNTTVSALRSSSQNYASAGQLAAGQKSGNEITLFNPNIAEKTVYENRCASGVAGGYMRTELGQYNTTTQFTGITIFPGSSTITGTMRIYGLRNS